jgi:hypothetical protein
LRDGRAAFNLAVLDVLEAPRRIEHGPDASISTIAPYTDLFLTD